MVSTTEVAGDKKPNSKADWKNKPKTGKIHFKGAATSDSVLHQKVVTNDQDQAGQFLLLVNALSGCIGEKQITNWAESFRNMVRKIQADFIPARIRKTNYGVQGANPGDPFIWNAPAIDNEEDYETDVSVKQLQMSYNDYCIKES